MALSGLRLFDLSSPLRLHELELKPDYFRGEWLVGFGWDQHRWTPAEYPTHSQLDEVFPDFPVILTRADGHASWLNRRALERIGRFRKLESDFPTPPGGVVVRDLEGLPTGILKDAAKFEADQFLPPYSRSQKRNFLLKAIAAFNEQGFTHLRDMSGDQEQWEILSDLEDEGLLTLYIEENFSCENRDDFDRALQECLWARNRHTTHLRARGVKIYFDGALGSEGAYLSQPYAGSDNRGFTLWPMEDIETIMRRTWSHGLELSVHTIGDEAAHQIISKADDLRQQGVVGTLNIEHAQMLRPETIEILGKLNSICHMQPCHWLSDRHWLKSKLGSSYAYAFPWAALQQNRISLQWGSDAPIEPASIFNNLKALTESSHYGIPRYEGDLLRPHSHREESWGRNCETWIDDSHVVRTLFDGRVLNENLERVPK